MTGTQAMRIYPYRPVDDLTDTAYARALAAGAPTLPLYFLMPSGRVQRVNAVEDPSPTRSANMGDTCYLTERSPHYGYTLSQWIGHPTPDEAVAEAIGNQTRLIERARAKLAKLEARLEVYNAAAEALAGQLR